MAGISLGVRSLPVYLLILYPRSSVDEMMSCVFTKCRDKLSLRQAGLGLKTKMKIFYYRESFSKFYRDSGINENENGYRKYENESGIFIRN